MFRFVDLRMSVEHKRNNFGLRQIPAAHHSNTTCEMLKALPTITENFLLERKHPFQESKESFKLE